MKKKFITVILAAVLIAALTGCDNSSEKNDNTSLSDVSTVSQVSTPAAAQTVTTAAESDAAAAGTEKAATALTDDELRDKLTEFSTYVTGKFSKAALNRIYDENAITVSINLEREPSLLIRVREAGDIPNAAFEASGIFREALAATGFTSGILSVSVYEKNDDGRIIDETMIAWRSNDGLTGKLVDGVKSKSVEDCTVDGLYGYFGDAVKPFTAEEAADFIKIRINKKSEGLLYESEDSVLVSAAGGSIAVMVRTYEEFLIPAAAEYSCEVAAAIAEKSELPLGRVVVNVYENDENGGILQETMIGWTTLDGMAGTYNSKPEGIEKAEMTLNELYAKYDGCAELIEQAKNNRRVHRDN